MYLFKFYHVTCYITCIICTLYIIIQNYINVRLFLDNCREYKVSIMYIKVLSCYMLCLTCIFCIIIQNYNKLHVIYKKKLKSTNAVRICTCIKLAKEQSD